MPSDDRLLLILRRLDEIERKLDHMLDELRTPTAIGYSARRGNRLLFSDPSFFHVRPIIVAAVSWLSR